jgi:hypothetical protein
MNMKQFTIKFKKSVGRIIIGMIILPSLIILTGTGVLSQNYSTIAEIYDFDVGDIFHYVHEAHESGSGGFYSTLNKEVVDKTYSLTLDTVIYTFFVKKLIQYWYEDPQYSEFTEVVRYTNLDSFWEVDTTFYYGYNGRKVSSILTWYTYHSFHLHKYVDGCGIVWDQHSDVHPPSYDNLLQMVYFKKGDEEWGTPHIVVSVKDYKEKYANISLYPNPANKTLTIKYLQSTTSDKLSIYDLHGRKQDEIIIPKGQEQIRMDVSGYPAGVYVAVLKDKKEVMARGKFVKR